MKIFAYGALMSTTHMKRIGIDSSSREPAILEGYELKFEKKQLHNPLNGAANIQKSSMDKNVYGILYDVSEDAIAVMDKLEEYPTGYTREKIVVKLRSGELIEAIVYVAHPDMVEENLLPTAEYVSLICESSDLLPESYLMAIRSSKTLEDLGE